MGSQNRPAAQPGFSQVTAQQNLHICEYSGPDEGNYKKNSVPGLPSLDLWFTANVISFTGRCICGEAV